MSAFAAGGVPPASRAHPSRDGARAFTILEVLIALVVLGLSLMGVLGLLIGTTKVASGVVEDTFAATLARSVHEAARLAARDRGFAVGGGPAGAAVERGFVMAEPGMSQTVPTPGVLPAPATSFVPPALPTGAGDTAGLAVVAASDFAIFLPSRANDRTFVYPRPTGAADGNTNHRDDVRAAPVVNARGVPVLLDVRRVYPLAHRADAPLITGDIPLSREAADQYSYAIVVRLARVPSVLDPSETTGLPDWPTLGFVPDKSEPAEGLFLIEVQVFRNFDPDPVSHQHLPVSKGRFAGLLAVGP